MAGGSREARINASVVSALTAADSLSRTSPSVGRALASELRAAISTLQQLSLDDLEPETVELIVEDLAGILAAIVALHELDTAAKLLMAQTRLERLRATIAMSGGSRSMGLSKSGGQESPKPLPRRHWLLAVTHGAVGLVLLIVAVVLALK